MTKNCSCGGRLQRTDIRAVYDNKLKRTLWEDTDPIKANFKCDNCGQVRTQRKRRARLKV